MSAAIPLGRTVAALALAAPAVRGQTLLYELRGSSENERFGATSARVGDVDGDGHADLLVGAYGEDTGGLDSGSVFLYSGADGSLLLQVVGTGHRANFGYDLDGVGDLDGDGFLDFIAGAPQLASSGDPPGYARVHSGRTGEALLTIAGTQPGQEVGFSVAGAGDVNLDGVPDLLVGSIGDDGLGQDAGAARIHSGANGGVLQLYFGDAPDDWLGWSVANAGDVNGDGRPDAVVGMPGADPGGLSAAGGARVYSGANGAVLHEFWGSAPNDDMGYAVAGVGDWNGDGAADVCVASPNEDPGGMDSAGAVRVFSGADGTLLLARFGEKPGDRFGRSIAAAGDVNLDGVPDLLVGAPWADFGGAYSGRAYLISGADGGFLQVVDGAAVEDELGRSVAGPGDVNGDGYPDLVVGVPFADGAETNEGAALVLSGFECEPPTSYCDSYPNSVGAGATIGHEGSASLVANDLVLTAGGCPPSQNGIFFYGGAMVELPFGDGLRCVGPGGIGLFRLYPPLTVAGAGTVERALDLDAPPADSGPGHIEAGSTWYFQFWYRDPDFPAGAGFNLSDGLAVPFCP